MTTLPPPEKILKNNIEITVYRNEAGQFISFNDYQALAGNTRATGIAGGSFEPPAKIVLGSSFADYSGCDEKRTHLESTIQLVRQQQRVPEFHELVLEDCDLSGIDLKDCTFVACKFTTAKMEKACLENARLSNSSFHGAILNNAQLKRAIFSQQALLTEASLERAMCEHAVFSFGKLSSIRGRHTNLQWAVLDGSDLRQADLSYANLCNASLKGATITGAKFFGARLDEDPEIDPEQELYVFASCGGYSVARKALRGANLERATIYQASIEFCDLTGANLRYTHFKEVSLYSTILDAADLFEARFEGYSPPDLRKADLRRANLTGVSLSNASMLHANLEGANLSGADLSGTNLLCANLKNADLSGTNLSGAKVTAQQVLSAASIERTRMSDELQSQVNREITTGMIRRKPN